MQKLKKILVILGLFCSVIASAAITFDQEKNTIKIVDYPLDAPCTLERLWQVDKSFEWNKISYDATKDVYTVNCDLIIGANDGTETCLVVGSKEKPATTLIMNGDLTVYPYWVKGENSGRWYRAEKKANRLRLGRPDDANIKPTLKFANDKILNIGLRQHHGGQLEMYNTLLTSTSGKFSASAQGFDLMIMKNSRVSNVKGLMFYGICGSWGKYVKTEIYSCVFDNFDEFVPGGAIYDNCVFSNSKIACYDYGRLEATYNNCVFKDNQKNFMARFQGRPGKNAEQNKLAVICTDCIIEPGKQPDSFSLDKGRKFKPDWINPSLMIRNTVVVKVTDHQGKPLREAVIKVKEDSSLLQGKTIKCKTDDRGMTPPNGDGAIVLTKTKTQITSGQPKIIDYTYTITATANGKNAVIKNFSPDTPQKKISLKL